MKKITKPARREEATYYSDFSGKCFGEFEPHIQLTLDFGYGSKYDGSKLRFDLDDKDVEDILALLKSKLSNDTKKSLKSMYTRLDEKYEDSVESRNWIDCEFICNEKELLERLI
jgi:hypothetical protein